MANRIKGISIEIDGNTTKLNKALESVNKTIRTTQSQLRDTQKLLKLDPTNTTLLTQRQQQLNEAISATKEKLQTLRTAAKQANDALAKGDISKEQYDALQREIIETEQNLKELEAQAKKSSSALESIANAGSKLQSAGQKISSVGQSLLPLTGAIAGVGTVAAKKFADVDKTMQLTNATMKNSEAQAKLLNDAMKSAAANSTFGMSDAATATLNFARAGLSAEQAASALSPAMNLAAGEGGNLDTVSAGLVATINGFHGSFDDASKYADVFAAACNNSALDIDSLSQAMSVAAPIFSSAGYSVNDASLYMGVMANNGIEASVAANSLKTGLARLVAPAKNGSKMMDCLGVSITNADGTMKDSVTIQRELHDVFALLSESEQLAAASAIFGKQQMAPWLALINTAPEDVKKLSNSLTNCAGTTDEMANAMMSGFGGSIEKLKSSIDVLMTSLGQLLAKYLTPIIEKIQVFVDKLNSLDPSTQKIIIKIGLLVGALGPLLIVVGKATSGIGSFMTILPKIAGLFGGLGLPILAVVAALGGLIAGFIAFKKSGKTVSELFDGISDKLLGFAQNISGFIKSNLPKVLQSFQEMLPQFVAFASEIIQSLINGITKFLPKIIPVMADLVNTLISGITQALPMLVEGALQIIMALINGITQNLPMIVQSALQIIQTLLNTIVQNLPQILNAALQIITALINGITQNLPMIINAAITMIQSLVTGITQQLPMIIDAAVQIIQSLIQTIADNLPMIIQAALDMIMALVQGLIDNLPQIIEAVFNIITTIVTTIIDNLPMIIDAAIQIIISLASGLIDALPEVISAVWNIVKNIISEFLSGDWLDTGAKILRALLDGILSMVGNILSSIGDLVLDIVDCFGDIGSQMLDIGKNMVEGIWDGISGAAGWLWDKISGFCEGIWDGVKSFFGINSPSKLFKEELGFNLVYGLGEGINEKTKNAVKAVNCMSKDIMSAAEKSLNFDFNNTINPTPMSAIVTNNYYSTDNSRTVNQTNNSPKSLSRLEIYRQTRNALGV